MVEKGVSLQMLRFIFQEPSFLLSGLASFGFAVENTTCMNCIVNCNAGYIELNLVEEMERSEK